jgi:hypothetical protein
MAHADTALDDKRRFVSKMGEIVANALDNLPREYRLALWLGCGCGMSHEDVSEALSCSRRRQYVLRTGGIRRLLGTLEKKGIFTDRASVEVMIGAMANQPSPPSLMNRIRAIVAMPACVGKDVSPRSVGAHLPDTRLCRVRSGRRNESRGNSE